MKENKKKKILRENGGKAGKVDHYYLENVYHIQEKTGCFK